MEKKVGLILAFKGTNYGALLQAYATQLIIERLGFDTEIIDYKGKSKLSLRKIFQKGWIEHSLSTWRQKKIKKKANSGVYDELFLNNQKERRIISNDFRLRRLHNIVSISDIDELKQKAYDYLGVVIGSDQKWGPGACYSILNSLSFVPDGVRRISYATSLGVSEYPKYCWSCSREMWKKIDFLSVREKQGADIVRQICGDIDVSVVLDPTYLLTKDNWEELVPKKIMNEKRYLFCFFLGNDLDSKKCASRYAKANNLELVSLFSNESFNEIDLSYADRLVSGASPEDFINWIRGAECVFTDSFHGLTFSVINQKDFFVFYRKRDDVLQPRNSRIDNILSTWNLEDRLIVDKNIDWTSFKKQPINYVDVQNLLDSKRNESLAYLKRALTF